MIEGKDPHLRPVAMPIGRPVHLLELGVVAQVLADDAAREEELQLLPAGIGRRAAMTRNGERPAGVGVFQGRRPVFAVEPALQKTRHEPVAGA